MEPAKPKQATIVSKPNEMGEWVEDIRRVFSNQFKLGLNRTYVQMIRLSRLENYQVRISINNYVLNYFELYNLFF